MIKKQKLQFQGKIEFAEGKPPAQIQILPTGKWDHPSYGVIAITQDDVTEFKKNFDLKIRKDIPITEGHEVFDEKPAVGWFTEVEDRGEQGLWGRVEWSEDGKTALKQKAFKYFSPEFYQFYEDPESREEFRNVLVGGALTNKPYFKELKSVVFSDKNIIKLSDNKMDLKELLKKKVKDLTAEEKTFINEHKDELSEDELKNVESIIEKTDKEKESEEKEKEAAAQKEKDDKEAEEKTEAEKKEASEPKNTVKITAAEYKALQNKADKGEKAFSDLNDMKVETEAKTLIFNEQNSNGRILPKHEAKVFSFMKTLNDEQRKSFCEIVNEVPKAELFAENGDSKGTDGKAITEVDAKVKAMMSEDKELNYSDAIVKVFADNKELAKAYEKEQAA